MNKVAKNRRGIIPIFSFLLLISVGLSFANAGTFTAYGPEEFSRDKGKPVKETSSFKVNNPDTNYMLYIDNGASLSSKVSSAIINLNGSIVFGTSDFSKKSGQLSKSITLSSTNELEVELRSQPGSGLSIKIEGEDNTPPDITISSPANGLYLNTSDITVRGSASDSVSWVEKVTVNGDSVELSGESFSYSGLSLKEGNNTITAVAADAAGNENSASVNVILDTIAPEININPVSSLTNNPKLSLSGLLTDASPIASLTINGIAVPLMDNQFQKDLKLIEGTNEITIEAVDEAGNKATRTVKVLLDVTPPQITIESPDNGVFLNTTQISVSGSAHDDLSGLSSITINDIETIHANAVFTLENLSLTEGNNVIIAVAKDKAGNSASVSISLTLDTIPPEIILKELPAVTNVSQQIIEGRVNDSSPLSSLTINGNAVDLINGKFSKEINLNEGNNSITVIGIDKAGNVTEKEIKVLLDTQPPALSITSPVDQAYFNLAAGDVSGLVNDESSGIKSVVVNGFEGVIENGSFLVTALQYTEGVNIINAIATDNAGNTSEVSISVSLDTVPPVIGYESIATI